MILLVPKRNHKSQLNGSRYFYVKTCHILPQKQKDEASMTTALEAPKQSCQ